MIRGVVVDVPGGDQEPAPVVRYESGSTTGQGILLSGSNGVGGPAGRAAA